MRTEPHPKRTERQRQFAEKNKNRRNLRATMRSALTEGQYREWRRMMRNIRFHSKKAQDEFFGDFKKFLDEKSHKRPSSDRFPDRGRP